MPLSNLPIFKQCCGTRPSRHQAAGECQPRFSIVRWSVADDSRLRGCAHDPEGPSKVVAERGCPWADSVHPRNPRIENLNSLPTRLAIGLVSPTELFLQHNRFESLVPALLVPHGKIRYLLARVGPGLDDLAVRRRDQKSPDRHFDERSLCHTGTSSLRT